MNAIARDMGKLLHAIRDADLGEDEAEFIDEAGTNWDWHKVETLCSILEKVREAGYLERDKGLLIHKRPEDSAR